MSEEFKKSHPFVVHGIKTRISTKSITGEEEYKDTEHVRFSNLLCAARTLVSTCIGGTVVNENTNAIWRRNTCIRMIETHREMEPDATTNS